MRRLFLSAFLLVTGSLGYAANTYTPRMGLAKPADGDTDWGVAVRGDYDIIDSSAALLDGDNTFTGNQTFTGNVTISSPTFNEIHWSDGTVQVSSPAVGGGSAYPRSGYSGRFSEIVDVTTSAEALDQIFDFSYQAPGITLASSPSASVKELGTTLTSVTLTATTVEKSSPITSVQWKANSTVIKTSSTPTATGGAEVYIDTGSRIATVAYTAVARDGTGTTTSSAITFTFVYPFYYGVGAQSLTGAQVQALTKLVKIKSDTTTVTSPSTQVYYFAYPQSYGVLTSILDTNGFETISGYTRRSVALTMLDATSQNYYIYEFNSPTTQTSFSNQYKY